MKAIRDNDTIQIEVTNACTKRCANCTRLVGHHPKPYFMDLDNFRRAVDSLVGFPKMVGVMGGEPLLHPQFLELCSYLRSKFPKMQCGLWTSLPPGKEHYAETICETFGHLFPNDHSRNDVLHMPVLVSAEEFTIQVDDFWYMVHHCYAQNSWSASINPNGAWFCEIAASLSTVLGGTGWPVKPNWWRKAPIEYSDQMLEFCVKCGMCLPLKKRVSTEEIDDISPLMYERLKETSPKIKAGKYQIHDMQICYDNRQLATYKDWQFRKQLADRYDMFLYGNEMNFVSCKMKSIRRKQDAAVRLVTGEV